MNEFDETREIISNMCEVKLKMNSHKGDIKKVEMDKLMELLRGEINELYSADTMLNTIEEAADCINYITAIVYKAVHKYRDR